MMAISYPGINDESIKTFFKDMQLYRDNFVLIGGGSFFPDLPKEELCRDICARIEDMMGMVFKNDL